MFNDFFIHAGEVWVFVKYPCILPEYGYVDSRTPIRMTKNNFEMLEIIVDPIPVGELYRLDLNSYYHKTALIDMEITEKLEVLPEEGKGDKPNNSGECNCEPIDLSNLATKEELNIKADKTEVPSIDGLASEEYVQQKITEALANFSPRKLFDIIAATELPEDGRENQICVITDNPVDKFRISDNLDDNSFSEDEIFVYLDKKWSTYAKPVTFEYNGFTNHIHLIDFRQGNLRKLDSYIYQDCEWVQLTKKSEVLIAGSYYNETFLGNFPEGLTRWKLSEKGLVCTIPNSGKFLSLGIIFGNSDRIDFSSFTKARIAIEWDHPTNYDMSSGMFIGVGCSKEEKRPSNEPGQGSNTFYPSGCDVMKSTEKAVYFDKTYNRKSVEIDLTDLNLYAYFVLAFKKQIEFRFDYGEVFTITDLELL